MANKKKPLKKQKIRNSEYYDMQLVLDELYAASVKGQRFCNLVELIKRPENIKLAYRNIRKNSGSRTAGVDNKTISDLNKPIAFLFCLSIITLWDLKSHIETGVLI